VNLDYEQGLNQKTDRDLQSLGESFLLERAEILRTVPSPRKLGYRTVFKLAVRQDRESQSSHPFSIGLFQRGTHQMGPSLKDCPLHVPLLRSLLKEIEFFLPQTDIKPFHEESHKGDLRYLVARTNSSTSELMLTWVVTSEKKEELEKIHQHLIQKGFPLKVSVMNIHAEKGNAIWGPQNLLLTHEDSITENFSDYKINLGPSSFFQVNPWQAENIYLRIKSIASSKRQKNLAWDLFSGVGPISLVLASSFDKVLSVEENTEAVALNRKNASLNQLEKKIKVEEGLTETVLTNLDESLLSPNLIVANPSRRGLHPQVRKVLKNTMSAQPEIELIYLSCDISTFQRDLKEFKKESIFLTELQGFDMHSQTGQLEWLGRLRKG